LAQILILLLIFYSDTATLLSKPCLFSQIIFLVSYSIL
jgi:hypothetical protein